MELCCCALSAACVYCIKFRFSGTYEELYDTVPWYLLTVISFFVAACVHPTLNGNWITDTAWAFSMYLEGVAVLPQLMFFRAKQKEIERFTSHFIAF
jgi:hypothetical protein